MLVLILAAVGLVAGIGITAVGPGGVLATVGLVLFTDLSPAMVSGTALVTQLAAGTLGALAFLRSGQLRDRQTLRLAVILVLTAVVGAPLGVVLNSLLTAETFGILLAALLVTVAVLVWLRERAAVADGPRHRHPAVLLAIGFFVATVSGIFGVGGPLLSVPLLVALGIPVLSALAAAQAQSIAIALVGGAGYIGIGAVDWWLALVVGVPQLCGVLIGWKVARSVPARYLRWAMIAALIAIAPVLALQV